MKTIVQKKKRTLKNKIKMTLLLTLMLTLVLLTNVVRAVFEFCNDATDADKEKQKGEGKREAFQRKLNGVFFFF